ncbi:DinB family protein [Foetidibacter luteolus]|uniref:DinB family protein n=1 Tax=Foetidibacter luteolus TaxID=2608880 RepID=UPI001A996F62|nr:DinB family protein [Foetidibacter luteolus]
MQEAFRQCLWKNFGAAIDMLKSAVELCPDELWQNEKKFFYLACHTAIFLDYYLTIPVREFSPLLPFTLVDADKLPPEAVDDVIPNRLYSRQEIMDYLSVARAKCKNLLTLPAADKLNSRWIEDDEINLHGLCPAIVENYTILEILFYNLRHVQHHVAQLNVILRQKAGTAADWVSLADD